MSFKYNFFGIYVCIALEFCHERNNKEEHIYIFINHSVHFRELWPKYAANIFVLNAIQVTWSELLVIVFCRIKYLKDWPLCWDCQKAISNWEYLVSFVQLAMIFLPIFQSNFNSHWQDFIYDVSTFFFFLFFSR